MKNIFHSSAKELNEAFVKGDISAEEIVSHFNRRITKYDPKLKAFLKTFPEKAIEQARELDQKRAQKKKLGKLAGVPIALKDNIHLKGELSTCASQFLKNYVAPFSSTVTRLLVEEDALIIGKTNMDEFAMGSSTENSAFFSSHNPWQPDFVPGGSSGGSAVAVSARLAPISLGSDTGGSIRQPASFCGIVGYKPTYGRVSRYGLVAFGSSLDQIGPFAHTTKDVALLMEIIGKHCPKDSTSLNLPSEHYLDQLKTSLNGLKIGIPWQFLENLSKSSAENFAEALKILKDLGAELIDVDLNVLKYSIAVYYILATAEASTNLARFDGVRYGIRSPNAKTLDEVYDFSRREGFGKEVKKRIMLGTYVLSSGFKDAYYKKAQKVRTIILKTFEDAFQTCDLVVMPTSPTSAFKMGAFHDPLEMYLQDIFTVPANLAGLPAISLPFGFDEHHRPYGIQFLGPQLHDVNVIRYAHAFEKATKSFYRVPPLFDKEI